jgi:hypothetical protein
MAVQVDFKPEALERIARSMGHSGDMSKFPAFLASDPSKQHLMERYKKYAGGMIIKAAKGISITRDVKRKNGKKVGKSKYSISIPKNIRKQAAELGVLDEMIAASRFRGSGGGKTERAKDALANVNAIFTGATAPPPAPPADPAPVTPPPAPPADPVTPPPAPPADPVTPPPADLGSQMAANTAGTLPPAAVTTAENIQYNENQAIAAGTGEVTGTPTATATPATPATPVVSPAETEAAKIKEVERVKADTETALGQLETKELELDPRAQVTAQQQAESSVSDLDAAQGEATTIDPDKAPKRVVGDDELVSGSQVDMDRVGETFGTGEVKAASIVDELGSLMADFEGGNVPVWAKGAMRVARENMAARGLGGSSIASQAIIQAAMASALPIAQIEAGNKQAMALEKARYRAEFMKIDFDQKFQTKVLNAAKVENAANMQFSADQQITLENSRTVNTMNLQNLSNKQSMVLAEASALANLDMANLNNRQQAEVMNAQSFLQVDMANFTNQQQIEMFKAQSRIGALFSDQAAGNAAQQFNASSENQMTQFFKNMQTQVQQFNVAQQNTMSQFNAGQSNSISQFNTQIQNQRDQFNAQNQLVIAQSNAQWRRQIATADTAAVNRANEINAQNALSVSQQAYANLWQERADKLKQAWQTAENAAQMEMQLALQESKNSTDIEIATINATGESISLIGAALAASG